MKKSLGLVSVEFGQTRSNDGIEREAEKRRKTAFVDGMKAECVGSTNKVASASSNSSSDSVKMREIVLGEDADFTDFSFESGLTPPPVEFSQPCSAEEGAFITTVPDSDQAVTPT